MKRIGREDISPEKYLLSMLGKINYVLHVCPQDEKFIEYKTIVKELLCKIEKK
jgi:CCR4-NOT transcriptional regulation complex NOT5 subunit